MGVLILIVAYLIGLAASEVLQRKSNCGAQESLCLTCANAVVTRGTRGQEWITCNYGGGLRPVKFAVCECTCYRNTQSASGNLVRIEGFARDQHEVYEEVAIS